MKICSLSKYKHPTLHECHTWWQTFLYETRVEGVDPINEELKKHSGYLDFANACVIFETDEDASIFMLKYNIILSEEEMYALLKS